MFGSLFERRKTGVLMDEKRISALQLGKEEKVKFVLFPNKTVLMINCQGLYNESINFAFCFSNYLDEK